VGKGAFMDSRLKMAILVGVAGVTAGSSNSALATPMRFDCDSFDGAYSEVAQIQSGPTYSLKAKITPKRLGKHRDWRPNAMLQIKSADGKNGVTVRVTASSLQNRTFSVTFASLTGGELKEYSVATVKTNEPVSVAIAVRDGKLQAAIGGQLAEGPIAVGKGAEVRAGCSTGQFVFENLEMNAAN
jgi:hypothetical protein